MAKLLNSPLYLCSQCKKVLLDRKELIFSEDSKRLAFCSETCVEHYYRPLVEFLEKRRASLRTELGVSEGDISLSPEVIGHLFSSPDEVWRLHNSLGENIFSFIKRVTIDGTPLHSMGPCLIFDHHPSFILGIDMSAHQSVVDAYRIGEKIKDVGPFLIKKKEKKTIEVDRLKAELLAELIKKKKDIDIQVEQFHLYDVYFHPTLESPDLVTEWTDANGELYHIYSKAFEVDGMSFYYLVASFPEKAEAILGLPTVDGDLYAEFTKGRRISGMLKN